ncbi:MAG: hypothetical protein HY737_03585 [Candidatus Omnitrophica bacterium]|nr:hypothetical protein [Candidatus Omnitrophota bacterium]
MNPLRICFKSGERTFSAAFNDTAIAQAIGRQLPMTSTVQRWGEEIYFDVPVRMKNTSPTRDVKVGDVAYWPEGPSLCIFFGKTPASKKDEPRPTSDVTIIGHTDAPAALLHSIEEGTSFTISR